MSEKLGYIEVLEPGLACSIQDIGRYGYMSEGVPISGAMDQQLLGIANLLLANSQNKAVIEWKLTPPRLKFLNDCIFSVVGLEIEAALNDFKIKTFKRVEAKKGDVLKIKQNKIRGYGYIAVKMGFQSKKVLGSRSFYKNITPYDFLKKGMKLPLKCTGSTDDLMAFSKLKFIPTTTKLNELEAYKGPEFNLLPEIEKQQLLKKMFSINNQSNRMGFLLNERIKSHSKSILSSPVLPGTVQWTPSGKLIVLMRDAQTVGGYPRILQLKEDSISYLSRLGGSDFVKFNF